MLFEKFGEFDSAEELNRAAAAQLAEGDIDAIYGIAEENGIDREDAEDYIDGAAPELCTPIMAALGKLKVVKKKLTRQLEFTAKDRKAIHKRDNETCVFCAAGYEPPEDPAYCRTALQIMHIVPRSQLGMGVEQNGVLGCVWHHQMLDNGNLDNRKEMIRMLEKRMRRMYPGWTREKVTYRKDSVNEKKHLSADWGDAGKEIEKVQPGSRTVPPEGFVFWETKEEAQDVTSKKIETGR